MPPRDLHYPWQSKAGRLIFRLRQLNARWPAAPELQNVDERTVTDILDIIDAEEEKRSQSEWGLIAVSAVFIITCAGRALVAAFVCGILTMLFACASDTDLLDRRRYAVYALTQTNDLRVLPALIRATRFRWGRHPEVIAAIRRLLTQVTERHAGLLNREAQQRLWYLAVPSVTFEMNEDEALALNALQALTYIGSGEILRQMQQFVCQPGAYPMQRRIINAMQQHIPIIEARLQRQQIPDTLLRAADMPEPQPGILLRAASAATPESAEQLLRADLSRDADAPI